MGLGENFKALSDAQFLAKLGASIIVTDSCNEHEVADAVKKIRLQPTQTEKETIQDVQISKEEGEQEDGSDFKKAVDTIVKKKKKDWRDNITFRFGGFKKEDFENRDLIIRDMMIDEDISFLRQAQENGTAVEVAECLFVKLAPPITLIGIAGTCGKSTVAAITNEILKNTFGNTGKEKFYFIDEYRGFSPLSLLGKIVREDVVLMECPIELLSEFDKYHVSPHIAVITNMLPDSINHFGNEDAYFARVASILKYQTYNNFFIANDDVVDFIKNNFEFSFKAKILRTSINIIPAGWVLKTPYYHMKEDVALALRITEVLKVPLEALQEYVESFQGLEARMQVVKKARGVTYYNDSASVHPYSTLTALKCLAHAQNVVLIWGGKNHGIELEEFLKTIPQYISTLVLLQGSGTLKFHAHLLSNEIKHVYAHSIYDAVQCAKDNAGRGDIVLFSPGFPAGIMDQNPIMRGRQFVWALKSFS